MGGGGRHQLQQGLGVVGVLEQALLQCPAELGPNLRVALGVLGLHVLECAEDLLDQASAYALDLAVVLEELAGDVQRQVVGVHDALHEAQVVGHERFAVVHDEHPLDVQLHAGLGLAGVQVEGGLFGDEE